jgi:Fur family iron response transcriptional regulator
MDHPAVVRLLEAHAIRPSAQRVAIAGYVLATAEHPSADQVWRRVKLEFPMVSRATAYNTLKLFVEKGLLRELVLAPGYAVYDPNTAPHHHFLDEDRGSIHDVPWSALTVDLVGDLPDLEVRNVSVVLRGRRRS